MSSLPMKMFVYGTLMRGFSNHHVISSCNFLGTAKTVGKYGLFVGSYPFVNSEKNDTQIQGELYEVSTGEQLQHLDELEGHPDYYCRTECEVVLEDGGDVVTAHIYFNNNDIMDGAEHVPTGSFKDSVSVANYQPR
jgi:gamma-glutamylcyclotransferase (GGCT)/AIG2-like uncharacterized protein YtfP